MGRTNPTYRDTLRALETDWEDYRRALRHRTTEQYDQLWAYARAHADAAGYLNHSDPLVTVLFSIALEQERRLDELAARLEALEE